MSQKLVLIDGHSILNRAFYGVPDLSNAEGLHTNAIYGFLNIMFIYTRCCIVEVYKYMGTQSVELFWNRVEA